MDTVAAAVVTDEAAMVAIVVTSKCIQTLLPTNRRPTTGVLLWLDGDSSSRTNIKTHESAWHFVRKSCNFNLIVVVFVFS